MFHGNAIVATGGSIVDLICRAAGDDGISPELVDWEAGRPGGRPMMAMILASWPHRSTGQADSTVSRVRIQRKATDGAGESRWRRRSPSVSMVG